MKGGIIYSPDIFASQRVGGVSRSIVEIATAARQTGADSRMYAGATSNVYLVEAARSEAWEGRTIFQKSDAPLGRIRGSLRQEPAFARFAKDARANIVHRSYYPVLDRLPGSIRVVETLHDMMWESFVERMSPREWLNSTLKRRALERADAIVCVSNFTRSELAECWPHLVDKSFVVPHGVRPLTKKPILPAYDKPFFLYVGSREPRKNFSLLPRAFARSGLAAEFSVVCVGGGSFSAGELSSFAAEGVETAFVQSSLGDDELAGHYEAAQALLYPSNYEGFGMPLLEAMIHRCPVISSRAASLPEVGGDSVAYADSHSSDEWAVEMRSVAEDSARRGNLAAKGHARALEFTWDRVGREYCGIYKKLA